MNSHNPQLVRCVIDWFSSYTNLLYLLLSSEAGQQNYWHELTQESLADILGVSLINVSRSLAELRKRGIIATNRKHITILDKGALMALCSGETL